MSGVDALKSTVKVCMFDQYGTVVDMQSGLTKAITPFLENKGYEGRPSRVVTWWRRTHFENSMIDALIDKGHTPYLEIAQRALSYTLLRADIPHTLREVEDLVSEIEHLRPFPDVVDSLTVLKRRYEIVVLSNGDPDMLENAKPYLGIEFDRMISVAKAGYFKPHYAAYRTACDLLGQSSVRLPGREGFWHAGCIRKSARQAFRRNPLHLGFGSGRFRRTGHRIDPLKRRNPPLIVAMLWCRRTKHSGGPSGPLLT